MAMDGEKKFRGFGRSRRTSTGAQPFGTGHRHVTLHPRWYCKVLWMEDGSACGDSGVLPGDGNHHIPRIQTDAPAVPLVSLNDHGDFEVI